MPVIKASCLPAQSEDDLRKLHKTIVGVVTGVTELGLKSEKGMTVLFPPDMMRYGLGEEVIIEVTGLFEKPERTNEVRQTLAHNLGTAIHELFPDAMEECFVYSFNSAQGLWP